MLRHRFNDLNSVFNDILFLTPMSVSPRSPLILQVHILRCGCPTPGRARQHHSSKQYFQVSHIQFSFRSLLRR